jgi:hypothetical protein
MSRMNRARPDGEQLIGALIPAVRPRPAPPPAPLPALPTRRAPESRTLLVDAARVDPTGRVWVSTLLRALGWAAGDRIDVDHTGTALIVQTTPTGTHAVGARGSLSLPAPQRALSGIQIAATVILVAAVDANMLLVCPAAVVGPILSTRYAHLLGARHER